MRTDAREAVLKILYSQIINPSDADTVKRSVLKKLSDDEFTFSAQLLQTIEEHSERIIQVIDQNISNFKQDRLFPVDRAILTIAVAEILYFDDIPPVVSANEATNIAQKYSTETSADFVGGVLSGVIKKCIQ
ncbi:MAG: transcription antitermination factor NusB [Clostridia bacterium]|nr:transcription antitermination factor NusB [Clostridia bacterium]